MKQTNATGFDDILTCLIGIAANELKLPLSILFHYSFALDIFPDVLKIARAVPAHKFNVKSDLNKYRPISDLSGLSKILEKLMYSRLNSLLIKHNVILPSQYAFRSKVLTNDALLDVTTIFYDNIL